MSCSCYITESLAPLTQDYMLPTPDWASWGAEEAGFDPTQQRVRKERRHPGSVAASVVDEEECREV